MTDQTPTRTSEPPAEMPAIDAVGGPASDPSSMVDVTLPTPSPTGHDLLVEVDAVSVNPVDVKNRARPRPSDEPRVLGFDAVGRVVAVGEGAHRFAVGDRVFYAGQVNRPGSDARFQLVNENIVGPAPRTLSDAEAAAVPLTAITAWEALFDRLGLAADSEGTLLVIGAAGGVGSLVIQFAKALTRLTVIAVASRPESAEWVTDMGADHVVGRDFTADVRRIAPHGVDYVFTSFTPGNIDAIAEVIRPRGEVVSIDETGGSIDALKAKSVTWHWELMFTRPIHEPEDSFQHELLTRVAGLLDEGTIRSTLTTRLSPLDAATLREAHRLVETSQTIGKVVVTRD
ncbi:zinc-binding alcohol dehydrogenase family protein [Microbacterium sp. 179-I 3D4 NHS]|uniref:zinc-binding alcohol dehydrogenase family protein n=1 Tax=Microbacterium sp. 179-I 3D4 NHS TaxID=3142381 RepID=UPI0039A2CE5D